VVMQPMPPIASAIAVDRSLGCPYRQVA
jgi:hypothetical protein